jgi:hypothetical protein
LLLRSRQLRHHQNRQPYRQPDDAIRALHAPATLPARGSKSGIDPAFKGHNDCQRVQFGMGGTLLKIMVLLRWDELPERQRLPECGISPGGRVE